MRYLAPPCKQVAAWPDSSACQLHFRNLPTMHSCAALPRGIPMRKPAFVNSTTATRKGSGYFFAAGFPRKPMTCCRKRGCGPGALCQINIVRATSAAGSFRLPTTVSMTVCAVAVAQKPSTSRELPAATLPPTENCCTTSGGKSSLVVSKSCRPDNGRLSRLELPEKKPTRSLAACSSTPIPCTNFSTKRVRI